MHAISVRYVHMCGVCAHACVHGGCVLCVCMHVISIGCGHVCAVCVHAYVRV